MNDLNSVLFVHYQVDSENESEYTSWSAVIFIISTVGMALSTIALIILILTAVLFVEWRSSYKNQLLIQFMLARYIYTFIRYLQDIQNQFNVLYAIYEWVTFNAFVIIYTEMALIVWMFLFSRQMYISLVRVFDTQVASIWKISFWGWISPAFVSLLFYLLEQLLRETNNMLFCSLLITIKWPVIFVNGFFLISILLSVLCNKKRDRNDIKIIVVMMFMIFIFCFQQLCKDIFTLIHIITAEVDIIAFTIVNSNVVTLYQCAFSILFWLFGNENTRKLWKFQSKDIGSKPSLNVRYST